MDAVIATVDRGLEDEASANNLHNHMKNFIVDTAGSIFGPDAEKFVMASSKTNIN